MWAIKLLISPVEWLLCQQGPVSLRLMTSQFKYIVSHTQQLKPVKCIYYGVWVQTFVWYFKGALWNCTQNFEPLHCKICILRGVKIDEFDILELWHFKSSWDGPVIVRANINGRHAGPSLWPVMVDLYFLLTNGLSKQRTDLPCHIVLILEVVSLQMVGILTN